MGRVKEFCIDLINANDCIPEGITLEDVSRMRELKMYNWEQYERHQENNRSLRRESENSAEAEKVQAAGKIFEESLRESNKQQKNKQ